MLLQVPLVHNAGLNLMNLTFNACGTIITVETLDPLEILGLIDKEHATFLCLLPPSTYIRLLDVFNLKDFDTTSVRTLLSAVAALSKPLLYRLFDAFPNATLRYGYSSSETLSGIALWINREMVEKDLKCIKSVGREHPFTQVRLVDDEGRDVPTGETGEAIFKSPSCMLEYFDQPDITAETIKDGWVHTGDLLKKDEDGFFYFMDRKKDMIKTGGENVFAQEVEKVILTHASVENCAVFGVPDPVWGEAVTAVVKLRSGFTATQEEIVEHCKESLSSYKKPRRVEFVDNIPISDAGKVQKFKLREQYSQASDD